MKEQKDKSIAELLSELKELKKENSAIKKIYKNEIIKQKLSDKRLHNHLWRKEKIIESSGVGTWEWNVQTNELVINNQWAEMLGYSISELSPISLKTWENLAHPDDFLLANVFLEKYFAEEIPKYDFVCRMKHKDGHWVWVHDVGFLISKTKQGKPLQMFGTHTDITDRMQMHHLLNQNRENYENFFNTINDFLFVLNEQGNIIHTNNTVRNRLGYSSEELIGNPVLMIHPPERRVEAGLIVKEMLEDKREFCPVPIITKSGDQIPVQTRVTKGIWDGKPVIFGVSKDISELQLSEEKFSKVFLLNPSACGLSDLNTRQYIQVNEAFTRLLGFSNEEVIGKTAVELGILTPDSMQNLLMKIKKKGATLDLETDLMAKNGEIKHVILSAEDIYVQDKILRYTVVNDITQRKCYENKILLKNKELQKLNKQKDRFFSIIAHDLKNPFNTIVGFSELMAKQVQNQDYEDLDEFSQIIEQSSRLIMNLLDNLMQWSRSQTGKMSLNLQKNDMNHLINETILLLSHAAQKKLINIKHTISQKITVFADKEMIATVLRNLIFNAIKFTPDGGEIVISVQEKDGDILVYVKDTGVGIEKNRISKLFRIDGNASTPGTQDEKGTGLGLILCKEFIEKHHGRIWVESINSAKFQNHGTTFYFTIPNNLEQKSLIGNINTEERNTFNNLKVLIVEDDEPSIEFATMIVKQITENIIIARDGVEAVEICRLSKDIDLVLMDIKMPRMDGYEATQLIRRFNKEVIIIAQTAFTNQGDKMKALEVGCDDYIPKPITPTLLFALIQKYFIRS